MNTQLHALFVDDETLLAEQYFENLRFALREVSGIELTHELVATVEEGKVALPRDQARYQLVVVDLLWDAVGIGRNGRDSRGLEVVEQAAKTEGVVIVGVSVGDTTNFPELEQEARAKGAHVFRVRGALQAASRSGGWEGLAEEIADVLRGFEKGLETRPATSGAPGEGSYRRRAGARKDTRRIFVVCGRNQRLNTGVYEFLRALGLAPYEWEQLVSLAIERGRGGGNPNIFEIVEIGFEVSFGALVIFSPDNEVQLRVEYRQSTDPEWESVLSGQARPNVLLEAGYALSHDHRHTLIVTIGEIRPLSDLSGKHMLTLDDSHSSRKACAERLRTMGFDVNTQGDHWLEAGDLSG